MVAYSFDIKDSASGDVARLVSAIRDRLALHKDMARRMANDIRSHFLKRQQSGPRNKFGAPSSNFWADVRDSVNDGEGLPDGGRVAIAHAAAAQKYYGGTITKDDKLLAIPARREAYGKSPRLFDFLRVIVFKSGTVALAEAERSDVRRVKNAFKGSQAKTAGLVWYWLVDKVTQKKDPNTLPPRETLEAGLLDTAQKHFERQTKRKN